MDKNKDCEQFTGVIRLEIFNNRLCILIASRKFISPTIFARLGVPGWLWNLLEQMESSELPILVSNRVMQGMCPDVSPETVQGYFRRCRLRTGHFEDTRGNAKTRVGGRHFDTGYPLSHLTTSLGGDLHPAVKVSRVFINSIDFSTSAIRQCCGGAEVGKEIAIC